MGKSIGRRILREFAQSKGKEAVGFVRIEDEFYNNDTLVTLDSDGREETLIFNYKELFHWMVANKKFVNKQDSVLEAKYFSMDSERHKEFKSAIGTEMIIGKIPYLIVKVFPLKLNEPTRIDVLAI